MLDFLTQIVAIAYDHPFYFGSMIVLIAATNHIYYNKGVNDGIASIFSFDEEDDE